MAYTEYTMNKTLYVKESEAETWKQAETLATDGLSPLVSQLLREYVNRNQPPTEDGFERIEVKTYKDEEAPVVKKAFTGRWLFTDLEPEEDDSGIQWDYNTRYSGALTQKGNIAVLEQNEQASSSTLEVYGSFDDIKGAEDSGYHRYPENVVAAVAEALNQPYTVELDW